MMKVPKSERNICLLLLAGLVIIVSGVIGSGFLRPAPEHASKSAPAGYPLPAGWKLAGPWEIYPKGRLYEKIDGQETLFYEHGALRLEFAEVTDGKYHFDVYVYQMADVDGAMGIFLAQTPSEFTEIDLGNLSDISSGQVRAFSGHRYLEIQPQEKKVDDKLSIGLAKYILDGLPREKSAPNSLIQMLPKTGRVKGSLSLNKESTFGLKSLNNSFSASYEIDGKSFDFLVKKVSAPESAAVLKKVQDELKEFEGKILASTPNRLTGVLLGKTLILVVENNLLFGISGEDANLEPLLAKLRKANP